MTGATSALPKTRAIFSESKCTRRLCLPNAMCGPFCSVPPIGTMIVVFPDLTRSRSSVHVSSSRNTESGAWARAAVVEINIASNRSRVLSITLPYEIAPASEHSDEFRQVRIIHSCGREVTTGTTLCKLIIHLTVNDTTPKGECGRAPEPPIIGTNASVRARRPRNPIEEYADAPSHDQRPRAAGRCRSRYSAAVGIARHARSNRHPIRLRHRSVRRLHGAYRRRRDPILLGAGQRGRRRPNYHDRGPVNERCAASGAESLDRP